MRKLTILNYLLNLIEETIKQKKRRTNEGNFFSSANDIETIYPSPDGINISVSLKDGTVITQRVWDFTLEELKAMEEFLERIIKELNTL